MEAMLFLKPYKDYRGKAPEGYHSWDDYWEDVLSTARARACLALTMRALRKAPRMA